MSNRVTDKIQNLFRQDEVFKMKRSNAEETLANIFKEAGKEPNTEPMDELLNEKKRDNRWPAAVAAVLVLIVVLIALLSSCGSSDDPALTGYEDTGLLTGVGTRDSTPVCMIPTAGGEVVYGNDLAQIDASNSSEGYIVASYTGDCPKVKLQITGENGVTYTFNCKGGGEQEVFPLSAGSGDYMVAVYENIEGSQYATAFTTAMTVVLNDVNRPFLYPNQYVDFDETSAAVAKGEELAKPCSDDLEVVANVYNYMIRNITYDAEEAENVQSGYIPDVDEVLKRKTGICLDYAALMAAMLRSQRIPTRLEVGYAGVAYHAWISTYIEDVGWVNGIVEFDGLDWQMMDPTFAANSSESELKSFIGSGDNYELKYSY